MRKIFEWLRLVEHRLTPNGRAPRPERLIVLGFALIILTGTLLLCLPFATKAGESTRFLDALFTATSASCVTGLIVADTFTHWTLFGQAVLLALIQIGGLGFILVASIVFFLTRRRISMRDRLFLSASLDVDDLAGVIRLTQKVLAMTFGMEGIGAALLALRLVPRYGLKNGLYKSVFTSVSAFCNAGFDLFGQDEPFTSLTGFVGDPLVNLVIAALIILGGIGFFVWSDVGKQLPWRKLSVHTRTVLVTTGILLAFGTAVFYFCERNNPATLGTLPPGQKLLAAFFQSVTYRTAGFNTVDLGAVRSGTVLCGCFLMLTGGSPGSTAGGIKTTTLALLVTTAVASLLGKQDVNLASRRISSASLRSAVTMLVLGLGVTSLGTFILTCVDNIGLEQALFESASAFGTVGLTMGITPSLSAPSLMMLIVEMYLGRVGILTLGVGVLARRHAQPRVRYPEGRILIG